MVQRPVLVIDASVVARWYLNNPPYFAQALQLRNDYLHQRIRLVAPDSLRYELSVRLGCSFYDAIYLMLSETEGLPFVHADQRLRNALGNRFPLAVWIEDYQMARE